MLTNATVKAARPSARPYKLGDSGGLYVLVRPNGRKTYRMKFRYQRREKLLTFGDFPDVALAEARELRDRAREQLRRGADPSDRNATNATNATAFADVARRWHAHQLPRWSAVHAADVLATLERDVFPSLGALQLGAIDAPAVLRALRGVEARGCIETARRLRQRISAVFSFAMSEGLAVADPAAIVARALQPIPATRRHPALLELGDARRLLADVDALEAGAIVKLASRFLALTAVRLAALRGARWCEIEDLDGAEPLWRIPAARMKLTQVRKADPAAAHLVPLAPAAAEILRAVRSATTQNESLIFPGRGGNAPIGEAAIGTLYIRAGYAGRHVPHGWRASFSTIMNERRPADRALIDAALAHSPKDKVEAAYNRAQHLERRREIFADWAQLLA